MGRRCRLRSNRSVFCRTGFRLRFTKAVDRSLAAAPASYHLKRWYYEYHAKYGSSEMGTVAVTAESAAVAPDGKSVDLKMPLQTGQVYAIDAGGVKSGTGEELTNRIGWYTLNRLQTAAPSN